MHEPSKDVTVGGKNYRIGRFTALSGSWIVTALPRATDEATWNKIQLYCLKAISQLDDSGKVTGPIMMEDGRWAAKELEYDLMAVMELTNHALEFNLSDFSGGSVSKSATPSPA